jgi:hypothetical protein
VERSFVSSKENVVNPVHSRARRTNVSSTPTRSIREAPSASTPITKPPSARNKRRPPWTFFQGCRWWRADFRDQQGPKATLIDPFRTDLSLARCAQPLACRRRKLLTAAGGWQRRRRRDRPPCGRSGSTWRRKLLTAAGGWQRRRRRDRPPRGRTGPRRGKKLAAAGRARRSLSNCLRRPDQTGRQ